MVSNFRAGTSSYIKKILGLAKDQAGKVFIRSAARVIVKVGLEAINEIGLKSGNKVLIFSKSSITKVVNTA